MELSYLHHRHQASLIRAAQAASLGARRAHEGLAKLYAGWIAQIENEDAGRPFTRNFPLHRAG